jgi:hypothetical protein
MIKTALDIHKNSGYRAPERFFRRARAAVRPPGIGRFGVLCEMHLGIFTDHTCESLTSRKETQKVKEARNAENEKANAAFDVAAGGQSRTGLPAGINFHLRNQGAGH